MIRVKVIQIDADVLEKFPSFNDATVRFRLARDIMEGARAKWIKLASTELQSTRADYIAGIQPLEREGKDIVLSLVGVLPNMVEEGWDGGFLHETMLSDEQDGWKISADGYRYRAIPFRHKTPGAGPVGGQPMGSQYSGERGTHSLKAPHTVVEDVRGLGKKVHGQAKKLITKREAGAGVRGHTALPEGLAPKLRQHHVTDVYAGMIVNKQPVSKGSGVGFQRTYTTFRTISEASPDKFFHPGIQARDFMDRIDDFISEIAPKAIEAFAQEVLK